MEHTYAVIMAGGGGTRLWPISRRDRPKQLLPLIAEESLFQATVKRLEGLFPVDQIFVVTVGDQALQLNNLVSYGHNKNMVSGKQPLQPFYSGLEEAFLGNEG